MIEKLKSGFKTAVAIGFTLALLGSKSANAQWVYYGPPVYYRPPVVGYRTFVGRIPIGTGIGFGGPLYGRFPGALGYDRFNEREGKQIIRRHLRSKKIPFKEDRPLRIKGRRITRILYSRPGFRPDIQVGDVIIEYRSPEDELDSEYKRWEFERRKEAIRWRLNMILEPLRWDWTLTEMQKKEIEKEITFRHLDLWGVRYERDPDSAIGYTIIKPYDLRGKPDIYKELEQLGVKVFYIEAQKDAESIKQKIGEILPEVTKDLILREEQAEEIISERFDQEGFNYEENTTFKTNGLRIPTDFLIFFENKALPVVIEYFDPTEKYQKRRERIYEKYKQIGGIVFTIKPSNKEEMSATLEGIINNISRKNNLKNKELVK